MIQMGVLTVKHRGDFKHLEAFFKSAQNLTVREILEKYGEIGVEALQKYTPKKTGKTASSWAYKVTKTRDGYRINWLNTNVNKGVNIAVIIQTGHATGTGGYVQGVDYLNPTLGPIFQHIADNVWKEVTGS